jgi:hypothetical protein
LVPVQLAILGEQAFGLLGLYTLMSGLAAMLDFGLTLVANREAARLNNNTKQGFQDIRNLLRTLEIPYWLIGILIGTVVTFNSRWIANNWIHSPDLNTTTVAFVVTVIGIILFARWPVSLYRGTMYGIERQGEANALTIYSWPGCQDHDKTKIRWNEKHCWPWVQPKWTSAGVR